MIALGAPRQPSRMAKMFTPQVAFILGLLATLYVSAIFPDFFAGELRDLGIEMFGPSHKKHPFSARG
ncbi:hypothetical protein [Pseudophaeobacter sp. TrK17]|uniref:hypothetical protein n=1 Tax=Pseudophaeobacter sp. TrK17 TaxID=2815167 RepID=UPI0035D12CBD